MTFPIVSASSVAWVDADQMREIDRVMIEDLGISLLQMMENAGRWLAETVRSEAGTGTVVVFAGSGGNGGGGLVAARHLHNAGFDVTVALTVAREHLGPVPSHQLAIIERMGLQIDADVSGPIAADVVVDAMVGYSLKGPLRGAAARVAEAIDDADGLVVSLDIPSGVDAESGTAAASVSADVTVTLCLPKLGLRSFPAVGRLLLADISVPATVVTEVTGGPPPPFALGPVLELV